MHHKIKGLVIKEQDKGESGKLLTLLTEKQGVITVNAKGVRKLSAAYLKSAQLFAFSEMLLYEKNGFFTLVEANLLADFYAVREDAVSFALACYICEAASVFSVPGENEGRVLRLVLNSLFAVEKKLCSHKKLKLAFELRLCAECGFALDATDCCFCGEELLTDCFFDLQENCLVCGECASASGNESVQLTKGCVFAVRHIVSSEQKRFLSFALDDSEILAFSQCTEKLLLSCAEKQIKSLKVLRSMI